MRVGIPPGPRQNVAQSVSQVLFCFPTLGSRVLSQYRRQRHCGASEPRKEKQKSYNDCSAVLMVHRFRFSVVCVHPVLRKRRREVTRKLAAQFETLPPSPGLGRGREALEPRSTDRGCTRATVAADLGQPVLCQPGIRLRWLLVLVA